MTWFDITPFFYFLYNSYLLSNYKYLIYKAKLFILKRKFLPIKKSNLYQQCYLFVLI